MAVIVVEQRFSGNLNLEEMSLWLIPVTLICGDKCRTIDVLLDTGSEVTIISNDVLEWAGSGESRRGSGVTGSSLYTISKLDKLEIGSIPFTDIEEIWVGRLPRQFNRYPRLKGILGGNILKMLKLTIDYPEKLLRIEKTIVSC
jgi:predicted aspartyl protease